MLFIVFNQLVQQIMPQFVTQRSMYEARERPSKTYGWPYFILANVARRMKLCLSLSADVFVIDCGASVYAPHVHHTVLLLVSPLSFLS